MLTFDQWDALSETEQRQHWRLSPYSVRGATHPGREFPPEPVPEGILVPVGYTESGETLYAMREPTCRGRDPREVGYRVAQNNARKRIAWQQAMDRLEADRVMRARASRAAGNPRFVPPWEVTS